MVTGTGYSNHEAANNPSLEVNLERDTRHMMEQINQIYGALVENAAALSRKINSTNSRLFGLVAVAPGSENSASPPAVPGVVGDLVAALFAHYGDLALLNEQVMRMLSDMAVMESRLFDEPESQAVPSSIEMSMLDNRRR